MSDLSNQQQNQSFVGILQVPGGVTSTLKQVQDGDGNNTGLWLSSTNTNIMPYDAEEQVITATAGQTVFNLSISYTPATDSLQVFVNGLNKIVGIDYLETDTDTVTFLSGQSAGALVKFTTAAMVSNNAVDASNVAFVGVGGAHVNVQDLADPVGSDYIGFKQAGTGAVTRSVQDKAREWVSPEDFGAAGDGTTDDIDALIAAHNTRQNVKYDPTKTYYVEPSIGNYSKCVPVYEGQIVDGQGASILCTNGGKSVFLIDARANIVTHHINGINVSNFFIASDKTGYSNNGPLDFEYFLTVRGGYIMMSQFQNLSAAATLTGTNPSCRSVVYFDLNDPNGSGDVGAPDGVTVSDMYLLGAYGTSCGVLFDGSTSPLSIKSRVGKVQISNIYLGCINPVDYDNRSTSTGKNAPVIFNKCDMHYSQVYTLFGGVSVIRLYNQSVVRNTPLTGLYNELVNPQSSGERGLVYADGTSYFEACLFEAPQIYAIGVNFAPSYNYKMFDSILYSCHIARPYLYENDQNASQVPANLINLPSASYGNTIDHIEYMGLVGTNADRSDYSQKFITAPKHTDIRSFIAPYKATAKETNIAGAGNTLVFSVPAAAVELRDSYKVRFVVYGTSGTVRAFAAVSAFVDSATTTFSSTNNVHEIVGTVYFNTTSKAVTGSATLYGEFVTSHNGGNFTNWPATAIYTVGNNLEFYVQTVGAATLIDASIECIRGSYATLT
jgi:hypothetical protein